MAKELQCTRKSKKPSPVRNAKRNLRSTDPGKSKSRQFGTCQGAALEIATAANKIRVLV